jgi:6-phospho-3-hexuloisomerase
MMKNNYYDRIIIELKESLAQLDEESIDQLLEAIISANRIFLAGTGRSGLIIKCFAMRLMQLGLSAFIVGETTTPGIVKSDLLIIGSGSGETGSVSIFAKEAKKHNARLGLITAFPDSTIGKLADIKVFISGPIEKNILATRLTSIQYGGTLFEQSMLLVLDGMALNLMEKLNVDPSSMSQNHANLE